MNSADRLKFLQWQAQQKGGKTVIPVGHPERAKNLAKFMEGAHPSVLNEDGTPKVFYHGTPSDEDFSEFKPTRIGEFGPAIYFSSSKEDAGDYSYAPRLRQTDVAPRIIPVHLNIKNPFTKGVDAFWKTFGKENETDAMAIERAKQAGYDGIIEPKKDWKGRTHNHFIAFHPHQIKSAIGNNGQFDPTKPEIHKADGGHVQGNTMPTLAQMKMELSRKKSIPQDIQAVGINEAPDLAPKLYMNPVPGAEVPPGGVATPSGMPIGGIDTNKQQPGQQLMPQPLVQQAQQQPQQPQGPQGQPPQGPQGQPQSLSNILQMTRQGQALSALKPNVPPNMPQGMAEGGQPEEDYRGSHRPSGGSYGAPMHDLTQIYPDDVYSHMAPRYYGTGEPEMDRDSFRKAHAMRGKPNQAVKIYRAVPKDPKIKSINPGDWVTINRDYAKQHGESALRGKYKILSKIARAKHLWTSGDSIHEWGYHPTEEKAKGGLVKNMDAMRLELTKRKAK